MTPGEDRDSAPWWAAVRAHRLTVQRCASCDVPRFPPTTICARCRSRDWSWIDVSGRGTVASWIVTRHAFLPVPDVPYVVALVRLAEHPELVMYGDVRDVKPSEMEPDLPVRAVFDDADSRATLVRWVPEGRA
jgi:uncharacterized OB-fold protein